MKILVVDDHAETRVGMKRILEDSGHPDVITARSTSEALDLIKQPPNLVKWKLDLVITDLDMGKGADGLDLLKEADAKHSSIRFWIVSSGMTNGIAIVAKELGAEQAISKSDLLQVLKDTGIITSP